MAITHFIDSTASEIARARIKSLTNRVPEAFPVLVYGDTRPHNFVFWNGQTATVESYSGNASYSLRVTLGQVQLGPKDGTWSVTCGSTESVPALGDAATLQDALNLLTTIISEGGVVVSGTFPNFLVTWNTVGVKTAFTVDSSLLIPQTGISLVTTQTGSASVVNQVAVVIRQAAISSQTSWTIISSPNAGWTGTITTNTAGALQLLTSQGEKVGEVLEVGTLLTAEVLDNSGIPVSYYQTPVILRAKNLDPNGTLSPVTSGYTLGDILYGNAQGGLSKLPGSVTGTLKFLSQTGDGVNSAVPAWIDPDTQGVTSVGLSLPSDLFTVSGSPVTSTGTLTGTLKTQVKNTIWAGPTTGVDAAPAFRTLVSADLPALTTGSFVLTGNGSGGFTNTDLTYSTPTLTTPDGFNISSAGSIALTAGGSNKNITITPSGTGALFVGGLSTRAVNESRLVLAGSGTLQRMEVLTYGANSGFVGSVAGGTSSVPAATPSATSLVRLDGYGFDGMNWSSASRAGWSVASAETFTPTQQGTTMAFSQTMLGTLTSVTPLQTSNQGVLFVGASRTLSTAWATNGGNLRVLGSTLTDGVSSGTVATAVASSFLAPTFAASNATTFTNAATVYIGGDVANGTNVTLTNSYGLWNVGKTRLDGAVQLPSTNTAGLQLYNTASTSVYERAEMRWSSNAFRILTTFATGSSGPRSLQLGVSATADATTAARTFSITSGSTGTPGTAPLQADFGTTGIMPGSAGMFNIFGTSTGTSGSMAGLSLTPTYNQASGTAANDDLSVIRTETAVGSGVQRLMNLGTAALGSQFAVNNRGGLAVSYQSLSGAGAVNVTNYSTELTSTGGAQALTLADGVAGQIKVIVHGVDGGSMVLTPTTKTGFTTITFTNAGESATLQFFTTRGWIIIGLFGAVAA